MRVAFASQLDPSDISQWSGTPYFLATALRRATCEVQVVGPLRTPLEVFLKGLARIPNRFRVQQYHAIRNRFVSQSLASLATRKLGSGSFDYVLCTSSILGAYLSAGESLVTWEDSTIGGMLNYYPSFYRNFSKTSIIDSHFLQQRSLERARISIFASDWAAQSAIDQYRVDPKKVRVIPFGANLENPPKPAMVELALQSRLQAKICRLLFIGVEWERKDGDTVLETAEILHRCGIEVLVDIVGVKPPQPVPGYVHVHGFVSKANVAGRALLDELFLAAHFLFVPSIAECYGLVYAEASAFGVPSLSRRTGGIPSVVQEGENGYLLSLEAPAEAFAELIRNALLDSDGYAAISRRARALYDEKLNWNVAVATLEREVTHANKA